MSGGISSLIDACDRLATVDANMLYYTFFQHAGLCATFIYSMTLCLTQPTPAVREVQSVHRAVNPVRPHDGPETGT